MEHIKYLLTVLSLLLVQGISFCQEIDVDSIAFVDSLPVEIIYNRSIEGNQINLGRNHFLSFPGSFDDPSRLLIKYPGISTQNDQANFIIYDGMPPHYVKWTLYDTDIVNPNHLSNAGTISDRNSRASGGVNSFSGQILGNFSFRAQPGMDGDQLTHAGSANMKLRTPYENKMFFNVSAIGLEAGIERKLNDSGSSNLIANYRYSFTGLLGQMGVDFGGEVIAFQDAYAKVELDNTFKGKLSLFGMYGSSSNNHAAQDSVTVFKDALEINYSAHVLVLGANHISNNRKFQNSLIYSSRSDDRTSQKPSGFLSDLDVGNSTSEFKESRISLHSQYHASSQLKLGLKTSNFIFDPASQLTPELEISDRLSYVDFHPYARLQLVQNEDISLSTKVGLYYETGFNEFSFLPSIKGSYHLNANLSLNLNYGLTTQMQAPELYQVKGRLIGNANMELNRSSGHHVQLGLTSASVNLHGFYHRLSRLAAPQLNVMDSYTSWFSDLSNLDLIPNQPLSNAADANIYGVSLSYNKEFENGFYFSSNATVLKSETTFNSFTSSSPYDFGSILNLRGQKKFKFSKYKYLNVSAAFHYRGGGKENEIDLQSSKSSGRTVYKVSQDPYPVSLDAYHRLDLRVSYVKKKSKHTKYKSVISMDIQNLYGRENDSFHYYDPVTEQVELQKQLGLLPVISYRLEF